MEKDNKRKVTPDINEELMMNLMVDGVKKEGLQLPPEPAEEHVKEAEQDEVKQEELQIDFINFKVVDKKVAKRTVVQERPLTPLRTYKPLDGIAGKSTEQNVFLLEQFTIADDKVLLIEIFEKNGGRHQTLQVENSDLIKASLIDDMHLKF